MNQNLTIDKDNNYLLAREGEKILVMKGIHIYIIDLSQEVFRSY